MVSFDAPAGIQCSTSARLAIDIRIAISRRTSYLRVRLEFLPYPHLIPTLFNGCGFGPPLPFTATSTWTWVDHPVSGLLRLTVALLRLGFPSAPDLESLTLPASATRRTVLQKVRGPSYKDVPQLVNIWFQVLFHSPPGVLFTFPSQYYALSVTNGVFSLTGWSPHIQSRFHVSRPTLDTAMSTRLSLTGLSPSLAGFPKTVLLSLLNQFRGPNPSMHARWFGLFRFRSPLLTESHVVFSSSGYLDVSVHRVPFLTLWIGVRMTEVFSARFPHSEISGSMGICPSPKLFAA